MSKAAFRCYPTRLAPNAEHFRQKAPGDVAAAKLRKRAIAERLKGSGSQLADATPKSNPRGQ